MWKSRRLFLLLQSVIRGVEAIRTGAGYGRILKEEIFDLLKETQEKTDEPAEKLSERGDQAQAAISDCLRDQIRRIATNGGVEAALNKVVQKITEK